MEYDLLLHLRDLKVISRSSQEFLPMDNLTFLIIWEGKCFEITFSAQTGSRKSLTILGKLDNENKYGGKGRDSPPHFSTFSRAFMIVDW